MKFAAVVAFAASVLAFDSPMQVCEGQAATSTFQVTDVAIEPYPLRTGSNVVVKTTGMLQKELTTGSKMTLVAKLGFIKIIDETYDLCVMQEAQGGCPIKAGNTTINFERMISDKYPNANINMEMKVYDAENNVALCMNGKLSIVKNSMI